MPASPTQLTLRRLRNAGWLVAVAERWNPHARIRQDLFGFGDVIACRGDKPGALIVQTTTADHAANRLRKLRQCPAVRVWLQANNRVQVDGWRKSKATGRWRVTTREVRLGDLESPQCE